MKGSQDCIQLSSDGSDFQTLNKRKRRKCKRSNKGIAGVKKIFLNLLISIDYISIILCYIWINICFGFYSSVKNPETKKSRFLGLTKNRKQLFKAHSGILSNHRKMQGRIYGWKSELWHTQHAVYTLPHLLLSPSFAAQFMCMH